MDQQAKNNDVITVTAYAGHRAEEKPQKFVHQTREYIIKKIVDQTINESLETGERSYCFKVVCQDDQEREIRYHPRTDKWQLTNKPIKNGG